MKLTDQNIPPALLAEYKKLFATKPANLAGVAVARTTKRARAPAPSRRPRKELRDYEKAVDFMIAYLTSVYGHPPAASFRAAQIDNIKRGVFDTAYWTQCAQDSAVVFTNTPTSAAWAGPRAYAYPDPLNLPSVPTYGAGVASSGPLDYTGATISGTFKDLSLKWRRHVFSLTNPFTHTSDEPVFLTLTGSVAATANVRASRAMLSAIIKRWFVLPGSTRLTTTEAPTIKPMQAFWRYRTPRGASPYYAYTNTLRLVYSMRSKARNSLINGGGYRYEETPGDLSKLVLLIAPMPMMGKRFNNNTSVASTLTATVKLWQIRKCVPARTVAVSRMRINKTTDTTYGTVQFQRQLFSVLPYTWQWVTGDAAEDAGYMEGAASDAIVAGLFPYAPNTFSTTAANTALGVPVGTVINWSKRGPTTQGASPSSITYWGDTVYGAVGPIQFLTILNAPARTIPASCPPDPA